MKEVYYKKVGRRYVPVSEYDSNLLDAFPKGVHLVMSHPGGKSTRFNVDPNYAAMIAAGRVAEDAISKHIMDVTEIRRQQRHEKPEPLTTSQRAAWDNLVKEFGDSAKQLEWPSARECAENAVKAMQEEAFKLMENESVRKAYDHFQLMCKLAYDNKQHS
jgi:hypothetical protein